MYKVPLYVSGKNQDKYTKIYKNFKDKDKYFFSQDCSEGHFGLYGTPFNRVFKDKADDEKYYFPIVINLSGIVDVIEKYIKISKSVLLDVTEKKCKILVVCPYEGWHWDYWQTLINKIIKKYPSLSYQDFVVLNGNLTKNKKIKSVYFNFFERNCLYEQLDDLLNSGVDRILRREYRNHKFLYMNRRPHYFRIAAVSLLFGDRQKGLLSLGINGKMHEGYYESQEEKFKNDFPSIFEIYNNQNLKSFLPLVIQDGINAERDNPVVDRSTDKFYDSYLHVVAETFHEFSSRRAFFSEKIFKPMMFMQPFVLIGEAYGLANLRRLGYRTFDKIIDESYDTIEDNEQRMYAAVASAKEFYNKPKEELDTVMIEILPILMHNINHLRYRAQMNDINVKTQLLEFLNE